MQNNTEANKLGVPTNEALNYHATQSQESLFPIFIETQESGQVLDRIVVFNLVRNESVISSKGELCLVRNESVHNSVKQGPKEVLLSKSKGELYP